MRRYIGIFSVSLLGIVTLLLTSRLEEVARFITIGASGGRILLFILYQIPYILQIALPISAFIAGYSVSSRMSQTGELTACRASGASLLTVFNPILLLSTILSLVTFLFIFDLAAKSHLAAKILEYDVRAEEPLALLQSGQFLNNHSIALELTGSLKTGSKANDMIICLAPKGQDRLTLALFVEAEAEEGALKGETLSLFTTTEPKSKDSLSTSCIESAKRKTTPTTYIHELTQNKQWKVHADHLPLSTVMAIKSQFQEEVASAHYKGHSAKNMTKQLSRFQSEPWRRVSLSCAVLTLTFVGIIFGVYINRSKGRFHFAKALLPFFFFMAMYLMGKNLDEIAPLAIACYLIPHIVLTLYGLKQKQLIEEGRSI